MARTLVRRTPRFIYLCNAVDDAAPSTRFGWRLVAANNRALGRAARMDVSLAQCRASAQRIRDEVVHLKTSVQFDAAGGDWSWRLALGGSTVAVCIHPYLRRVECTRALDQFFAALAVASPADGVVKHFGPRSLRGYDSPLTVSGTSA